eukprot:PhM_4_TR9486/c1_g1_i1/m.82679
MSRSTSVSPSPPLTPRMASILAKPVPEQVAEIFYRLDQLTRQFNSFQDNTSTTLESLQTSNKYATSALRQQTTQNERSIRTLEVMIGNITADMTTLQEQNYKTVARIDSVSNAVMSKNKAQTPKPSTTPTSATTPRSSAAPSRSSTPFPEDDDSHAMMISALSKEIGVMTQTLDKNSKNIQDIISDMDSLKINVAHMQDFNTSRVETLEGL